MSSEACRAARAGALEAGALASKLFEGAYRCRVRGPGLDYMDFRDYQPGDDVRLVDWRVSARTPSLEGEYRLIVREHETEGSVELMLLIDASRSMAYGLKPRLTGYVCSALLAAERMGDRVSVVVARESSRAWRSMRPREALELVLRELCRGYGGLRPLASAAKFLRAAARRVIAVVVTDYVNPAEDYEELVRSAAYTPLLLVVVADPSELEPPPSDALAVLEDLEGGELLARLAEAHAEALEHVRRVRAVVRTRASLLEVKAATPAISVKLVRRYAAPRSRRAAGWVA